MPIITPTPDITDLTTLDLVNASVAKTPHDELLAHINLLNVHHDSALVQDGKLTVNGLLQLEDQDATPVDDAILRVVDGVLEVRNSTDLAYRQIKPESLGTGTLDGTKFLRDDGVFSRQFAPTFGLFKSGKYYTHAGQYGSNAMTIVASRIAAVPFKVYERPISIDRIAIYLTAATAGLARLGVYEDDGSIYPGNLVLDAGEIDISTTGAKALTISQQLSYDTLYWFVLLANASASATCRAVASDNSVLGFTETQLASFTGNSFGYIKDTITYGPLPDPFPAAASDGDYQIIPAVAVRIA